MKRAAVIVLLCVCTAASLLWALSASHVVGNVFYRQSEPKLKLWPLDWVDIALFTICGVCLSLAGGAGIGGGAVLVPCFILIRGWPTPIAVALSNVTVLGGSFANFICNVNRHRLNGSRTIDWELIIMMEPTTIAGALFGAILNKLLPNYITTFLLDLMLTFMALRLYRKSCEAYAKETALLQSAKHAARAAKHAAAEQQAALDQQLQQAESLTASGPSLTIRTSHQARPSGPSESQPSFTRSLSRSINRSISRLKSPLLMQADEPIPLGSSPRDHQQRQHWRVPSLSSSVGFAAAAAAAATIQRHHTHSVVTQTEEHEQAQHHAAAALAGAAADAGEAGLETAAPWLPAMLRGNSYRQLLDVYNGSALFQGDMGGDATDPVVALPLDGTFSSSSSSDGGEAPAGDVEAGVGGFTNSQDNMYDENDDLSRPLLADAGNQSGSGVNDGDAEVHVSDAEHRQRDVPGGASLDSLLAGVKGGSGTQKGTRRATSSAAAAGSFAKPYHRESCLPLPHLATLLFLSAWVVASDIAQSSTHCGSWQYWVASLSVLLPVVVILLVARQVLLRKYRHDDLAPGAVLPDGQLHWTATTTLLYPALCSSAGLIAGLFGIGGGVVKGPLMLELGVPADVAAATSATMIMFTSASACVVYTRFGQILVDYGLVFILLGFFVTLCSQLLTFVLIKLLGRRSVIVFMMVTLMSIATGIMYIQSVIVMRNLWQHPEELTHFGRLCPAANQGLGYIFQQLALRFNLVA